jgi:GTPase SAR1 family protein
MTFKPPNHIQQILNDEGVLVIVGTGRSGKTLLGHLLATYSSKPKYTISYPDSAIKLCPSDWSSINPDEVFTLKDCVLVIDDAALFASSRNFNSPWAKAWVQFQTIISHKSITLIFIIQSTNLLDIGTLRSQRMSVLYKYSDETNIMYERDEFKSVALTSRQVISRLRTQYPLVHEKAWVYDHTLGLSWSHPIPSHWCNDLSTPYRDFEVKVNE